MTKPTRFTPELFDKISAMCDEYTGRPWDGTADHLSDTIEIQSWFVDAMEAHVQWLTAMREAAEREGREWTHHELLRQSRRHDGLATPRAAQVDWEQLIRSQQ